jgi:competence protein ComEA
MWFFRRKGDLMRKAAMAVITALTVTLMMAWALPVLADGMDKVNINTATIEELMTLDGIGETYAQRIIEFRDNNGSFQAPVDILNVKGIGEKILEANKGRIETKTKN